MALSNDPIWHPNATIVPFKGDTVKGNLGRLPSNRRRPNDPAKCTIHSTEGSRSGRDEAAEMVHPYTLIADPYRFELVQLIPLNYTSQALRGTHAKTGVAIETNHSGRMHPQVAIRGFADKLGELNSAQIQWLAEVVFLPIVKLCDIPNVWPKSLGPKDVNWILAATGAKNRLTLAQCHASSGFRLHQDWYGQDHWDPGYLATLSIQRRLDLLLTTSSASSASSTSSRREALVAQIAKAEQELASLRRSLADLERP